MSKKYSKIPIKRKLYLLSTLVFYDPPYQLFSMKWRFHKNDADNIITIPHGDCINGDKKYQLDPYNGNVYYKKEKVGNLTRKEYKRLWTDENFLNFVIEARRVYFESHKNATLPDVPNLKMKKKKSNLQNSTEFEVDLTTELQK